MNKFQLLALMATVSIMLGACSSDNEGLTLGSRDDIMVTNRGVPQTPMKEVTEVKIDKVVALTSALPVVEKVAAPVIAEVKETVVEVKEAAPTTAPTAVAEEEVNVVWDAPKPPAMPENTTGDVPPNAKPGECYAKVLIPAVTKDNAERMQVSEEQKVLARIIPAKYEVQTEQILIREARQYWKKGTGPVQKLDQSTGEIMCLVEEPAQYKTIEKRVLVAPEQPEYKVIPAQFETITKTEVVQAESLKWYRILCETNMGTQPVIRIQQALQRKGYDLVIDGKLGAATVNAITDYQTKNGLATRGITYETLEHLGVKLIGA